MIRTLYPPGSNTGGATKLIADGSGKLSRISMRVITSPATIYYAHSPWELLVLSGTGKQGGNILKDTSAVQDGKFDWKGDLWAVCDSSLLSAEIDFESEMQL